MCKVIWVAAAVFVVGGALVAVALWTECVSADTGIVVIANVALVAVTVVYVGITADIAKANAETVAATKRLADETATLTRETARMGEAAVEQADATADTLRHLQRPVLVLRIYHQPDERNIPMQIQNVGEGAAIWPEVHTADDDCGSNLLVPEPHIYPPGQFQDGAEEVVRRQRFDVPRPQGNECFLMVKCQDPRTGGALRHRWRIWTRDRSAWYADPAPEAANTGNS